MKKFLAILLAASLMLLFSCGTDEPSKENSEDSQNSKEASNGSQSGETSDVSSDPSEESESSDISESSEAAAEAFCGGKFDGRETIKLVALGDSIARGYGMSDPSTQSFPAILAASIESVAGGATVECENFGIDGLKTSGLLSMLRDGIPQLENADIVVVCIGANNLLTPFFNAFSGTLSFDPSDVTVDTGAVELFFDRFNEKLGSEELESSMNAGINDVALELPLILQIIKAAAPDAIIAVNTVYSPYHGMVLSVPYIEKSADLGKSSDRWVSSLNEVIREAVAAEECLLVESYDAFAEGENLVNARFSIIPPKFNLDPHPTIGGYIKLSNLYMSAINEMYGD